MTIKAVFNTVNSDLRWRNGQEVTVLRILTDEEADTGNDGKMFCVKFSDGMEHNVFEDEIER